MTAALDAAQVYAAFLSLTPVTPEGGEEALAGGFGTGFVDGGDHACAVLVHEDDGRPRSNGDAAAAIMAEDANCSVEPVVQIEGPLMMASCAVENASWAGFVASRSGLGPFQT